MALPGDVTTFTLTFGPYYDAAGEPAFAGMTGKIKPSRSPILHTDGSVLVDESVPVAIDAFGEASVELVHNDHGGGFTYSVVWDVASRKPSPKNKPAISVTSEISVADFDELVESEQVPGVVVPRGPQGDSAYDVAVANGFVGTESAWLASLEGPQGLPGVADDSSVAALIPGPGATADALRAAFDAWLEANGGGGGGPTNVVVHGDDPDVARPVTTKPVIWFGTIEPANSDDTLDVFVPVSLDGAGPGEGGTTVTIGVAASGVAAYGDSMVAGMGGAGTTPTAVMDALIPVSVTNYGVVSQFSSEIALRNGGKDVLVTAADNTIPAVGSVTVTVLPAAGWRAGFSWDFDGSLAGVPGTLSKSSADVWTFTRTTSGEAVGVPPETRWVSAEKSGAAVGRVLWAGRNNPVLADVVADVRAMAADAQRAGAPYMILPIFNSSAEADGTAGHTNVMAINDALAEDPNFYDLRGWLIRHGLAAAGITPTAGDTTAIGEDRIPPSLMSDTLHLNAAGYSAVGQRLAAVTAARGWYGDVTVLAPPVVADPGEPGGPELAPLTVSGVLRRYSALDTTEAVDTTVSTLSNLGSASGGMVLAGGTAPTKRNDGTRPYLQFGAGALEAAIADDFGTGPATLYAVGRYPGGLPSGAGFYPIAGLGRTGRGVLSTQADGTLISWRGAALASTLVPGSTWHVFIVVFNGASSVIRMDDQPEKTGNGGAEASNLKLTVGWSNTDTPIPVDLAEWGSFNRALDATERAQLVDDLQAQYALV